MLSVAILLTLFLAPASARCVDKYYGTAECLQQCQNKMGYPGMVSGRSRWDAVISPADNAQWTISQACGLSSSVGAKAAAAAPPDSSTSTSNLTTIPASSTTVQPTVINSTTVQPIVTSSATSSTTKIAPPVQTTVSTVSITPTSTASTSHISKSSISKSSSTQSATQVTTAPKSTPTSGSSSGSSDSGTSSQDIQAYLTAHNTIRALHGANDLVWNDVLADSARAWANNCQFKHSTSGEDLAAGSGVGYDIAAGVKSWTDEAKSYDPNNPQPSHFTQVVWKATTQVGCGKQLCDGIFDPSFGKALFIVCHYGPAGNVIGQFKANVQV